jgi:transcriptional regulator with XRE-family HTH domain
MCFIMNWKKELGIQIRDGRHDLFLRQKDLRERANVHLNMIGRYETGQAAPELDVLIQLAIALEKEEFRIGDHLVLIKAAAGARPIAASPKQMRLRLEYGKEYVFDAGNSSVKIQPSKEGLFITPAQRKASG